jgi:MHS family shikimate/dehydroshikimate transporter-like MFS transporter
VSLGYNLASIFAGALSPLIATGLMAAYKPDTWPISVYMIGLALITIVSVYFATETRQKAGPESNASVVGTKRAAA